MITIRRFFYEWSRWGLSTAWWNLRFNLGMWVGGFTMAKRGYGEEEEE